MTLLETLLKEGADPKKYEKKIRDGFNNLFKIEKEYLDNLETVMKKLFEENEQLKEENNRLLKYYGRDVLEEREILAKENKALKEKLEIITKERDNITENFKKLTEQLREENHRLKEVNKENFDIYERMINYYRDRVRKTTDVPAHKTKWLIVDDLLTEEEINALKAKQKLKDDMEKTYKMVKDALGGTYNEQN